MAIVMSPALHRLLMVILMLSSHVLLTFCELLSTLSFLGMTAAAAADAVHSV